MTYRQIRDRLNVLDDEHLDEEAIISLPSGRYMVVQELCPANETFEFGDEEFKASQLTLVAKEDDAPAFCVVCSVPVICGGKQVTIADCQPNDEGKTDHCCYDCGDPLHLACSIRVNENNERVPLEDEKDTPESESFELYPYFICPRCRLQSIEHPTSIGNLDPRDLTLLMCPLSDEDREAIGTTGELRCDACFASIQDPYFRLKVGEETVLACSVACIKTIAQKMEGDPQ